jgi:hypothetical protein
VDFSLHAFGIAFLMPSLTLIVVQLVAFNTRVAIVLTLAASDVTEILKSFGHAHKKFDFKNLKCFE